MTITTDIDLKLDAMLDEISRDTLSRELVTYDVDEITEIDMRATASVFDTVYLNVR